MNEINNGSTVEIHQIDFRTGETITHTIPVQPKTENPYKDKAIRLELLCFKTGKTYYCTIDISNFLVDDNSAPDDWECSIITEDETKRKELLRRWISDSGLQMYDTDAMALMSYEIVPN